jgi:hypothetical protein
MVPFLLISFSVLTLKIYYLLILACIFVSLDLEMSTKICSTEGIRGGYTSAKQNFPRKTGTAAAEITGLPLDAQMQRNRLDVDERVEGSRQCSCSRPS